MDLLHNLVDGLAIGAAYSIDRSAGVATTLAVFFHEVPQEIGDYAILVSAGFTKPQALLFNFVSALSAVIGTVIGLAVGDGSLSAERWILSFTAGGFLYLSMADLFPMLQHAKSPQHSVYHTLSITVGFIIMWLLAYYETEEECLF